jgi:hypothetical protein
MSVQKKIAGFSLCLVLVFMAASLTMRQQTTVQAAEIPADQGAPGGAPANTEEESSTHFVQRYLNAVASATSPLQLLPYLKPRADRPSMPEATTEEDKKMEAKMMAAFLEMQKASTPLKAEVTDSRDKDGKVMLLLKVLQVNPLAKLNLSEAKAAATGKVLLQKGPGGWLIVDEYWHYVYPNGLTTNSGHDPDATPEVASPIDKYSDDIMQALTSIWPDPAQGTGQVTIELKNSTSGHFEVLEISDKHGSKEAEARVKEAVDKLSLPPLPPEVAEQAIVNIQLSWSPKSKDTLKVVQLLHSPSLVK